MVFILILQFQLVDVLQMNAVIVQKKALKKAYAYPVLKAILQNQVKYMTIIIKNVIKTLQNIIMILQLEYINHAFLPAITV